MKRITWVLFLFLGLTTACNSSDKAATPAADPAEEESTLLFFTAKDDDDNVNVWSTDGTEANTKMVFDADLTSTNKVIEKVSRIGNSLYITDEDRNIYIYNLSTSQATAALPMAAGSTKQLFSIDTSFGRQRNAFGTFMNKVYFIGNATDNSCSIWFIENNEINFAYELSAAGNCPTEHIVFDNKIFMTTHDMQNTLASYDGTNIAYYDINMGNNDDATNLKVLNGALYYKGMASTGDQEIYKVAAGATSANLYVTDRGAGEGLVTNSPYFFINGVFYYFTYHSGLSRYAIWSFNGTTSTIVSDGVITDVAFNRGTDVWNNKLYFSGFMAPATTQQLLSFDGTTVSLVKEINATGHSYPQYFMPCGERLCFAAKDGVTGDELHSTDGTTANTTLVKDIHTTSDSYAPNWAYLY